MFMYPLQISVLDMHKYRVLYTCIMHMCIPSVILIFICFPIDFNHSYRIQVNDVHCSFFHPSQHLALRFCHLFSNSNAFYDSCCLCSPLNIIITSTSGSRTSETGWPNFLTKFLNDLFSGLSRKNFCISPQNVI